MSVPGKIRYGLYTCIISGRITERSIESSLQKLHVYTRLNKDGFVIYCFILLTVKVYGLIEKHCYFLALPQRR